MADSSIGGDGASSATGSGWRGGVVAADGRNRAQVRDDGRRVRGRHVVVRVVRHQREQRRAVERRRRRGTPARSPRRSTPARCSGVRLGAEMPPVVSSSGVRSKRFATPAIHWLVSRLPCASRGVWHSPHPATLRTRYSPRSSTDGSTSADGARTRRRAPAYPCPSRRSPATTAGTAIATTKSSRPPHH